MSGIFNGDSIYTIGGGGGYKDGGALVDADFIEVANNTVSTYQNDNRNELNFYFDVKPGEPLNSVIEVTNENNATVYVYITNQYGELIQIGYIGTNTINAGDVYNITIIGNSFIIENVTEPSSDPGAVIIDDYLYGCKKVGNRIWATECLGIITPNSKDNQSGIPGNRFYPKSELDLIQSKLSNGWRIANGGDWADLRDNSGYTVQQLQSVNGWSELSGNNASGLNFYPFGYMQTESISTLYRKGLWAANWDYNDSNSLFWIGVNFSHNRQMQFTGGQPSTQFAPIRICKTA